MKFQLEISIYNRLAYGGKSANDDRNGNPKSCKFGHGLRNFGMMSAVVSLLHTSERCGRNNLRIYSQSNCGHVISLLSSTQEINLIARNLIGFETIVSLIHPLLQPQHRRSSYFPCQFWDEDASCCISTFSTSTLSFVLHAASNAADYTCSLPSRNCGCVNLMRFLCREASAQKNFRHENKMLS